ncbi:hypothetical protein GCM10009765_40890 [Fodinicola feengrottensis]|uniref:Methyltransferase domain-containing protein n=1 Tax=Fodinicola feengrottensis TaxID=435914 RepID=A0ABN2HFQ3_9ACTN
MERMMDGTTAVWNRAALTYETVVPYFQPMGERLVARAGLAPGEHVLDVACGTGSSLVPAALAVTATGRAVGIDSAPTMVERANGALAEAGAGTAQALVMDCGELEFADGSFDVVLCGCALPFVGLDRGLPEIVRVLRPGGRFLSSGQVGGGPDWDFLSDLCREFELRPMPELTELPSPENIGAALIKAGLTDLDVTTDRIDVVFPDEDAWWRWGWSHGYRWYLEQLAPARIPDFKAAAFARLADIRTDAGIPLVQEFVIVRAVADRPLS